MIRRSPDVIGPPAGVSLPVSLERKCNEQSNLQRTTSTAPTTLLNSAVWAVYFRLTTVPRSHSRYPNINRFYLYHFFNRIGSYLSLHSLVVSDHSDPPTRLRQIISLRKPQIEPDASNRRDPAVISIRAVYTNPVADLHLCHPAVQPALSACAPRAASSSDG